MRVSLPQKHLILVASILVSFFLTFLIVQSLSHLNTTISPEVYLNRIALCLAAFFFPILGGWFAFRLLGGVIFTAIALVIVLFSLTIAKASVYLWFILEYVVLCIALLRMDDEYENTAAGYRVESEQDQNETNDLEVSYKAKGEGISTYFEKYSTYYHLRRLAEELVTSFSVTNLSDKVVTRCAEFIPRGDIVLMALGDEEGQRLSVIASHSAVKQSSTESKQGDMFDIWVVRNRQRLIVSDSQKDFRFDVSEALKRENLRSLVIVPLLHEGRVIGTLRINSGVPDTFNNDDLRLLDAIGTVASSAVSNAMLFEKTEELAIRDSLTGLYLRRYFFDRLKQEHRRFLITQRPLSLLMCDLDYFKQCNDRFGHAAGDLMLVEFSKILKDSASDYLVARYGGEEFAVMLTETNKQAAVKMAEQIRRRVEETEFNIRREKLNMTVSMGVACLPDDTLDINMLVQKADEALYKAKRGGRNKVCASDVG